MSNPNVFKMPKQYNNKIDSFLFEKLTHPVIDWAYKKNLTPNYFTTLSFLSQVWSLYYLLTFNPYMYAFLYILGYYFDCLDGPMARKYNMVTKFGDYYDHVTDIVCFILANLIYIVNYRLFSYTYIMYLYCFMGLGLIKYIGLQESYYDEKAGTEERSPFLYWTKKILRENDRIEIYKHFSFSYFVIFFSSIPIIIVNT